MGRLVGRSNECDIVFNNKKVTSLWDSGSQVSTVSESFAKELNLEIFPLTKLTVEAAGDNVIPYLGYVEAKVQVEPDVVLYVLLLVVHDTRFSKAIPVLLGTNALEEIARLMEERGIVPSTASMRLALNGVAVHSRIAAKDTLGFVSSTKSVTIPASGKSVVHGLTRGTAGTCMRLTVFVEDSSTISLPGGLSVSPSVLHLKPGVSTQRIPLEVNNFSDKDITIPPKTRLCELQLADVVPPVSRELDTTSLDSSKNASKQAPDFTEQLQENLNDAQVEEVGGWLNRWSSIFSQHDLDLGAADPNLVQHRIRLTDDIPFKERHRRIPPHMVDEVRNHIKEMLDLGVIRKSESPYASPVVLVRKKDGALRFCIDLRKLNSKTVRDSYALPRIEETLDTLQGAKWFSVLDLKSGYWQVEMAEEDKHKTAFTVGPLGFWECNRMAFGLTNAPATFQRLMETCMGDLYLTYCLIYLDDVVVFSRTFEEHLERLEAVFQRLKDAGLKLNPKKC